MQIFFRTFQDIIIIFVDILWTLKFTFICKIFFNFSTQKLPKIWNFFYLKRCNDDFFCNFVPQIKKSLSTESSFSSFFLSFFLWKKSYLSDFVLTVNQTLSRLSSHFSASFQPIGFLLLIFIWWNWTKSRLKYCTDFFILQILSSEYSSSTFY